MVSATVARDHRLAAVWEALADVPDPEIPAVSVVDLGVIRGVEFTDPPVDTGTGGDRLRVELLPTFVGCPAIEVMRQAIAARLAPLADDIEVAVTFDEPWTTERITPEGRRKLRESGFAPPAAVGPAATSVTEDALLQILPMATLPVAECPHCRSRRTTLDNAFGPTLCRAIYYCNDCRQPFEQFKSV